MIIRLKAQCLDSCLRLSYISYFNVFTVAIGMTEYIRTHCKITDQMPAVHTNFLESMDPTLAVEGKKPSR